MWLSSQQKKRITPPKKTNTSMSALDTPATVNTWGMNEQTNEWMNEN
jgi:hypothetical protein